MSTSIDYKVMENWEIKSALRTYVFPSNDISKEPGHYFAQHLISALKFLTEEEKKIMNESELEKQVLLRYLANTESIEMDLVNPALLFIMEGAFAKAIHLEAYRIYADEGFHATMCASLRESIGETVIEVPDLSRYRASSMKELLSFLNTDNKRIRDLRLFFAAAINETLITQSLLQAKDPSLKSSIRELISVHAMDEAQHHRYFAYMMEVIWTQMNESEKSDIADCLPEFFRLLLAVDTEAIYQDLNGLGLPGARASLVANQVSKELSLLERIGNGAKGSLRAMRKAKILNSEFVAFSFLNAGLESLIIGEKI